MYRVEKVQQSTEESGSLKNTSHNLHEKELGQCLKLEQKRLDLNYGHQKVTVLYMGTKN